MSEEKTEVTELLGMPDLRVVGYEVDEEAGEVRVECKSAKEEGVCPHCAEVSSRVHSNQKRKKRDLPIWGKRSWLELWQRRFWCGKCSKAFREELRGIRARERCTERYARYLARHYKKSSILEISQQERIDYHMAERLFYREAAALVEERGESDGQKKREK